MDIWNNNRKYLAFLFLYLNFDLDREDVMTEFDMAFEDFKTVMKEAQQITAWAKKELEDLSRASSLAVSQLGGTTKDGEARLSDFDLFDENDGLTKGERKMWAARDKYDMREGK